MAGCTFTKTKGKNDQERVKVKDPLVITLASIDFIRIDPKDLPKEVEKNRIDLFQIRPSQHQNNKGEADQGS